MDKHLLGTQTANDEARRRNAERYGGTLGEPPTMADAKTETRWPDAQERARLGPGWTEKYSRPEIRRGDEPAVVAVYQNLWDADRPKALRLAELRREGEAATTAKAAARRAEEERQERERVAAADAKLVGELRRRYLASDLTATEADFQAALPELRRKHREAAAIGADQTTDDRARLANLARY